MPIHKVSGGWQWGEHGKVYSRREDAVKQAQAVYSSGWKEKNPFEPRICPHCGAKIYTPGSTVLLWCPVCDKKIDEPGDWRKGWPKGGKRNPTEKYIKEFRSNLRYAYRNTALNMLGKADWHKLTPDEIKKILSYILETYYPIRPYAPGSYEPISKDEFMSVFRDVFKNEIKEMKGEKNPLGDYSMRQLTAYNRFIQTSMPYYTSHGMSVPDAMRASAHDWHYLKRGQTNPTKGKYQTLGYAVLGGLVLYFLYKKYVEKKT